MLNSMSFFDGIYEDKTIRQGSESELTSGDIQHQHEKLRDYFLKCSHNSDSGSSLLYPFMPKYYQYFIYLIVTFLLVSYTELEVREKLNGGTLH